MDLQWDVSGIANVIQTSVAPVFLMTGVATLLGVMTNRLGRVIDRSRALQRLASNIHTISHKRLVEAEMLNLFRRGRYINYAISFATTSALIICLVIMALFMSHLFIHNFATVVAILFILCMVLLIIALSLFLLEVFIATNFMRKGISRADAMLAEQNKEQ